MTPKISVVTLSYNRPEWLREAIDSIERQTHQSYEHLVYDNGSTDPAVLQVLKEAKARRPERFFYCAPGFPPRNLVGCHWNVLLGLSRGKYLTILDDDNRKHPEFLDKMSAPMDFDGSIEAVSCGWQPIDAGGARQGEPCHKNLRTSLANLWADNTIDSNALMFQRSVLDKIGQFSDLGTNEDWHFVIRLARHCHIHHLDDVLCDYRVHAGSRSAGAEALGLQSNWHRIRTELFTTEETREAIRALRAGVHGQKEPG